VIDSLGMAAHEYRRRGTDPGYLSRRVRPP
jgi:hypothetical protein